MSVGYQHVVVTAKGGPDVLELRNESALPKPGPGQVRVKVLAAGTGFTDTAIRRGNYPDVKDSHPFTLGYDIAGEVDLLGAGVNDLQIGQRVLDMPVIGGYSQYMIRPASSLVPISAQIDPAEAACLPLSYLTAQQMLTRVVSLKTGDAILIQGASGAVGTALLDLGRRMGLRMYGTCSPAKFDLVRSYGAEPFDYRDPSSLARMRERSHQNGGKGIAAVFDAIGGHRQWSDAMKCLCPDGCLVAYGAQKIARNEDSLASVLWGFAKLFLWWSWWPNDGRRARFYNISTRRRKKPAEFTADLRLLADMLAKNEIKPRIADRRPLADVRAVHAAIDAGQVSGKIILLPWG